MKPVVVLSLKDDSGLRCVDILRRSADFAWVECRRDPEDSHGWRRAGAVVGGFGTAAAARADAHRTVGWLDDRAGATG